MQVSPPDFQELELYLVSTMLLMIPKNTLIGSIKSLLLVMNAWVKQISC